MKINELTTGQGNVDVKGTIKEVGEPRTFNRFGRELKVVNAVLEDDSGSIKLTLWNEDANKFKQGDVVKITNGYVNEFQGEAQLTAGKFGKMEKVGEGEASENEASESEASENEASESESPQETLSDNTAETIAEDVAEDEAVKEAVKEEAPEETSEKEIEETSEELEEAEEE